MRMDCDWADEGDGGRDEGRVCVDVAAMARSSAARRGGGAVDDVAFLAVIIDYHPLLLFSDTTFILVSSIALLL